jgi:gas vesicle protein
MPTPPAESRPTFQPSGSSGSTRIWQVVSGVLAVALVAVLIMNFTNVDNGTQWKKRATTSEALTSQMQAKLKASEESAAQLKARTISLANEKAKAEDDQTVPNNSKKVADSISSKLDTCTADLQEVFSEIAAAATQADLEQIGANLRDTYAACDAAANAADGFSQYLQSQGDK